MEPFRFRIRFHFSPGDYLDSSEPTLPVRDGSDGPSLELKAGARNTAIKDHSRLSLVGGPFSSEEEAASAAERARRALLEWAVRERFPIDLGDGHPRSHFTEYGRTLLAAQEGQPIRNDVHGVDVYQGGKDILFASTEPTLQVGKNVARFKELFLAAFDRPAIVSDKLATSAELFCSSFFDVSFRSRFITLVTAVEALLEQTPRAPPAVALVGLLEDSVRQSDLDALVKQALLGSLAWLRNESIRGSGRALVESLLGAREYDGMRAPTFWGHCYDIRSQIVHNGKPDTPGRDLRNLANSTQQFVGDLLVAHFATSAA